MVTPNPPREAENQSAYTRFDSAEQREAADRALNIHLSLDAAVKPDTVKGQIFTVVKGLSTESILTTLSETLVSASAMANDLAFDLDGSRRHVALGLQQLIELGTLLANRALDDIELPQPTR